MKKRSEILIIVVLFSMLWLASFISYSGFYGADESGYIYFSRNLDKGLKECFQSHRLLHLSLLSVFPREDIIVKFYGYIFSFILIIAFYLIAKKIIRKEYRNFSLILLITSPIFVAMSPTAYTEIPALSLIMLSFYAYLKRKFYFSGVLSGISVFFKEIGLFMFAALVMDILFNKKDTKLFIKQISGFFTVFVPLSLAYFIFTQKIWFIDFFLRSSAMYSKKFSFVYDFILRRIAFFSLLGIGILPLVNIKKLKTALPSIHNVIKYYFIIALAGYFLFHAVSPRFSIFFLPVFLITSFFIKKKHMKFLLPVLFVQVLLTIYTIHVFTEPFIAEKNVLEFVVNNLPEGKVYGFGLSFWQTLKNRGFEIAHNISSADIAFVPIDKLDTKEFGIIKTVKIPCTLKFFRMLGCEEKEYAIALRKS